MFKFTHKDKEFILNEEKLDYMYNDEENPIENIDAKDILSILNEDELVDFDVQYYDDKCENCLSEEEKGNKSFSFLEYHFYLFTKENKIVTSNISKGYEEGDFMKLWKTRKVDNSYIVSIIVCRYCGNYTIEIEQCDM